MNRFFLRFLATVVVLNNLVALAAVFRMSDEVDKANARPTTVIVPSVPDFAFYCDRKAPLDFNVLVAEAAAEFGVDPWVLAVTVYRESDCRANAKGSSGEIGLAQVNPSVWGTTLREEGFVVADADLYDPRTNLRSAAWILSRLNKQTKGDEQEMFRRYNGAGPDAEEYARAQVASLNQFRPKES